jgi:phosphohistidine phosphatase
MWHSDRVRAIQTANILARTILFKGKMIQRNDLGPDDPVAPVIREIKKARGDLMIVGHQPFLGKLASRLLTRKPSGEIVKLSTSSIVALGSENGQNWAVEWLLPRNLI